MAKKRGRLSNTEAYYIHSKMATNSVVDIANAIGRSEAVVKKYIEGKKAIPIVDETQPTPTPAEPVVESTAPATPSPDKHSMEGIAEIYKGVNMKQAIRRARVKHKGRRTGVVMTEEMSGKADTTKEKKGENRFTKGAISKPYGDEGDYED